MQIRKCCVCDAEATYEHLGNLYCEPHIAEVTPRTEVYSRIVGYLRPIDSWSDHKKHEFYHGRKTYQVAKMLPKERLERPDVGGSGTP